MLILSGSIAYVQERRSAAIISSLLVAFLAMVVWMARLARQQTSGYWFIHPSDWRLLPTAGIVLPFVLAFCRNSFSSSLAAGMKFRESAGELT